MNFNFKYYLVAYRTKVLFPAGSFFEEKKLPRPFEVVVLMCKSFSLGSTVPFVIGIVFILSRRGTSV